jgi:ribokinase
LIAVIGSINVDLIATVDQLPSRGETVPGDSFTIAPGGKGANQALAAARAGAMTLMVGAVGQDRFAAAALAGLTAGAVDCSRVRETDVVTGTALILVQRGGENVIAAIPGANATVLPGDLARLEIAETAIVLLQLEIPLQTVETALDRARAAGARSVLNGAPFHAAAATFVGKADFLVVNEIEFDRYAASLRLQGGDRAARMANYTARTGRVVIVTLGRNGLVAAGPDGFLEVPALAVTPLDTVGAGDTFCGYFAAGLLAGLPLMDSLRRAAVAGSLACLKVGAQAAIPWGKEVDEALAASKPPSD